MSLTETQEQILEATAAVIVRDGIDGTNMRNVAKEADVSLGLLGYHFEGKQSLIVAAFQLAAHRLMQKSTSRISELTDPTERLRVFVSGVFDDEFLTERHLNLRLSLWAMARNDSGVEAVEKTLWNDYSEQLSSLISAHDPHLSMDEAEQRATDVMIAQNGLWLHWARTAEHDDLERGKTRCERIALSG